MRRENDSSPENMLRKGDDDMELHAFERMARGREGYPPYPNEMPCETCVHPNEDDACGDGLLPQPMTVFPDKTPPAMAYVPYQMWGEMYEAEKGFSQGTMFPVLDQPFCCSEGGGCK